MSGLSLDQMNDLIAKLNKLHEFTDDREKASTAVREARDRWNEARRQYAEMHAQIVAEYGEANAPRWLESIHGPRAVHSWDEPTHE